MDIKNELNCYYMALEQKNFALAAGILRNLLAVIDNKTAGGLLELVYQSGFNAGYTDNLISQMASGVISSAGQFSKSKKLIPGH